MPSTNGRDNTQTPSVVGSRTIPIIVSIIAIGMIGLVAALTAMHLAVGGLDRGGPFFGLSPHAFKDAVLDGLFWAACGIAVFTILISSSTWYRSRLCLAAAVGVLVVFAVFLAHFCLWSMIAGV